MEELTGDETNLSIEQSFDVNGAPRLTLKGELDISTVETFRTAIEQVIDSGPKLLVLELEELTFMDSSGISVMVLATKHIDQVELRHASDIIRRVIDVTGLSEILRVDPSRKEKPNFTPIRVLSRRRGGSSPARSSTSPMMPPTLWLSSRRSWPRTASDMPGRRTGSGSNGCPIMFASKSKTTVTADR